jgi:hypothetical protein
LPSVRQELIFYVAAPGLHSGLVWQRFWSREG